MGKIGACLADPFANGEGGKEIDTFTIPDRGRRRVYRPCETLKPSRRPVNPNNAAVPTGAYD
jgi:hypothetical protein